MPTPIRDYLGTRCPSCQGDILQQAPTTNRMPSAELAWCPSCHATHTAEALARGPTRSSLLRRLFGKPQRG